MNRTLTRSLYAAALLAGGALVAQQTSHDLGFKDTPILPGQPWHVHDSDRPHPRVITPGSTPGAPPSDAIVLFDGHDLSKWVQRGRRADRGKLVELKWKVENGYFEIAPHSGDLMTRDYFGDCQLHIEWASPEVVRGNSQARGNSGVYMMSRYEIQVLDSYNNPTYADGSAGAIYGQWPPLVNPVRKPGEWNTYDIVWEAPKFEGQKLTRPAYLTLLFNGVVVQNHKELDGPTLYRAVGSYQPHGDAPILLQDHGYPVRFRNIWIRKIGEYDKP